MSPSTFNFLLGALAVLALCLVLWMLVARKLRLLHLLYAVITLVCGFGVLSLCRGGDHASAGVVLASLLFFLGAVSLSRMSPLRPSSRHPIDPAVAAELERADWTPEEALRWYAAGRHYDTVPNGDGTRSARILDNGAVASNALKSMSRKYAESKGDVASWEEVQPPRLDLSNLRQVLTTREGCAGVFDLTDQELLEAAEGILAEDGELVAQTGAMLRRHLSQLDELLEYLAGRRKAAPCAEVSALLLSVQGRLETMRADLAPGKHHTSSN